MSKKAIRHGLIALAVCAACMGVAGCGGGGLDSGPSKASGSSEHNRQSASGSEAPQKQASTFGDQVSDVEMEEDRNGADAPPPPGGEEQTYYGRVVSIGDALYTAELQMEGELAVGTQADLEQWNAQIRLNPHALYLDCRVDSGYDLTGEQMEMVVAAMRGVELNPLSNSNEIDLSATGDVYTIAAVDELGNVLWKARITEHWIVASIDDVPRCFDSLNNSAFQQIGALQS